MNPNEKKLFLLTLILIVIMLILFTVPELQQSYDNYLLSQIYINEQEADDITSPLEVVNSEDSVEDDSININYKNINEYRVDFFVVFEKIIRDILIFLLLKELINIIGRIIVGMQLKKMIEKAGKYKINLDTLEHLQDN